MYKYARLPMGLKCSPDFAQATMENVLRGIDDSDVYIDDISAFSNDWQSHIKLLDEIIKRLRENGFTINPAKCKWAVKETDWPPRYALPSACSTGASPPAPPAPASCGAMVFPRAP